MSASEASLSNTKHMKEWSNNLPLELPTILISKLSYEKTIEKRVN